MSDQHIPKPNLRTSEKTERLMRAIAKFQMNCPTVVVNRSANIQGKDGRAGYKYDYASLDQILKDTQEARGAAELVVIFAPCVGGPVTCRITHGDSGEWMEADLLVSSTQSDPKSIGSAISYAKRYLLVALLGIAVSDDTDDDGAAAAQKEKKPGYGNQQPEPPVPPTEPKVVFEITNELELSMVNAVSLDELAEIYNNLPAIGKKDQRVIALKDKHKARLLAEAKKGGQNGG